MRRSVRSFNILPGIPTVIWTFEDCFIQISVAPTQCSNALPKCRISWSIFFCKRQDQRLWLSCRPLLSHMLAKVNSLPFITSILKDKTHMFRWKDFGSSSQIPTPPRQGSNPPPPGAESSRGECWRFGLFSALCGHKQTVFRSLEREWFGAAWAIRQPLWNKKYFSLLIIEIRHFRAHSVHLCNPQEHSSRQFFKNSWQKDSERRRRNFSLICIIWKGLGKIIISIHCNLLRSNR